MKKTRTRNRKYKRKSRKIKEGMMDDLDLDWTFVPSQLYLDKQVT